MKIHLYKDDRAFGPYTLDEVKTRLRSGEVSKSDLASANGGQQMPLGELLATILIDDFVAPIVMPLDASGRLQPAADQQPTAEKSAAASSQLYKSDNPNRGCLWITVLGVAVIALSCAGIWWRGGFIRPSHTEIAGSTLPVIAPIVDNTNSNTTASQVASTSSNTANDTTPGPADAADPTGVKRKPVSEMSDYEISKRWHEMFKGVDSAGKPIRFTPEEKRTNALLDAQASDLALRRFHGVFVRRDDSFIADLPPEQSEASERRLCEFKDVTFESIPRPLTGVERMNGLSWEGAVNFTAKYKRAFVTSAGSTNSREVGALHAYKWEDASIFFSVSLTNRNGSWDLAVFRGKEYVESTQGELSAYQVAQRTPSTNTASPAVPRLANHTPSPSYPYQARATRTTGNGICRVVFDGSGRVSSATMKQSTGSDVLDSNTISFAKANWTGAPNTSVTVPVSYVLQ